MKFLLFVTICSIGLTLAHGEPQPWRIPGLGNATEFCSRNFDCDTNQACVDHRCQCRFGYVPNGHGGCTQMYCATPSNSLPFVNTPNECSQRFGPNSHCHNGQCMCMDMFAVNGTTQRCEFDPMHSQFHAKATGIILLAPLVGVAILGLLLTACCCGCLSRRHQATPAPVVHEQQQQQQHIAEKSKPEEVKVVPNHGEYVSMAPVVHHVSHAPVVHHHQQVVPPVQVYHHQYHQLPATATYMPPAMPTTMLYQQPQLFAGNATCAYAPLPAQQAAPLNFVPMFNAVPVQQHQHQHQQLQQHSLPSPPPYQRQETAPIYPTAPESEQAAELPQKL